MERRPLLAAVASVLGVGCLQGDEVGLQDGNRSAESGPSRGPLAITGVYPDEKQRKYISYEYVELQNESDEPIQMAGYRLVYSSSRSHEFSELRLTPGATVVLTSRDRSETILNTAPPVHIRSAGFGEANHTSVMDGNGRVKLLSPSETVIDSERYRE